MNISNYFKITASNLNLVESNVVIEVESNESEMIKFEPNHIYVNRMSDIATNDKRILEYQDEGFNVSDLWVKTDIKFEPGIVYIHKSLGTSATGEQMLEVAYGAKMKVEYFEDMVPVADVSIGKKFDGEKPDWSLMPIDEFETVVKIMTFGKAKYGRENWKHVDGGFYRYYAAAMRHMAAHKKYMETGMEEHRIDDESNLPHLAHATCNLLFLMWLDNNNAHNFNDECPMPDWMNDMSR